MCGITGFFSTNLFPKETIYDMTNALAHRGPDDIGVVIKAQKTYLAGMGHRRLSIVDLSIAGHQPMLSRDENIIISFNGEIYNYKALKTRLESFGHKFLSNTDTEVILQGYQHWGIGIVDYLDGMFAIAIWDRKKHQLILARDRFGQKPLFYTFHNDFFAFASEIKSFFHIPKFDKSLNPSAVMDYFLYEYIPSEKSIYQRIKKLPAGHIAVIDLKQHFEIKISRYWNVKFSSKYKEKSETEIHHLLNEKLERAIKKRMMGDVPIGVFLSGGLDSSAIVSYLSNFLHSKEINTFSIGFEESSFDESNFANQVADFYQTNHHHKIFGINELLLSLPEVLNKMDEPFADASILPTFLLSKFTSEHVKVALGGDGGDELFCGYDTFTANYYAKFYQLIPQFLHKNFLSFLPRIIPTSEKNMSLNFKLKHFFKGVYQSPMIRNQYWLASFLPENNSKLFTNDFLQSTHEYNQIQYIKEMETQLIFRDSFDAIAYHFQKMYLADDILVKIDRASMMNSLEARSPFLDIELAEFVNHLETKHKFYKKERKYILKKVLENRLPTNVIHRKKKGFGIPIGKWFKNELKEDLFDTLSYPNIEKTKILNYDYISQLLKNHIKNKEDNRKELWTLYVFMKWFTKFID